MPVSRAAAGYSSTVVPWSPAVRERMRKLAARHRDLHLSDIHSINGRPERMAHWATCCRRYAVK